MENARLESPARQVRATLDYALGNSRWSSQELADATQGISPAAISPKAIAYSTLAGRALAQRGPLLLYLQGDFDLEVTAPHPFNK